MAIDRDAIQVLIPDNTSKQISPADVRGAFDVIADEVDSFQVTTITATVSGVGDVWTDLNAMDFAGNAVPDPAPNTFLGLPEGSVSIFVHNGSSYYWVGPRGSTISVGLGGTHVAVATDLAPTGVVADHAGLPDLATSGHPSGVITHAAVPVNYTPVDGSVDGNLQGVDAKLGLVYQDGFDFAEHGETEQDLGLVSGPITVDLSNGSHVVAQLDLAEATFDFLTGHANQEWRMILNVNSVLTMDASKFTYDAGNPMSHDANLDLSTNGQYLIRFIKNSVFVGLEAKRYIAFVPPPPVPPEINSQYLYSKAFHGGMPVLGLTVTNSVEYTAWPSSTPPPADSPTWVSVETGKLEVPLGVREIYLFSKASDDSVSAAVGPIEIRSTAPQSTDFSEGTANFLANRQWEFFNTSGAAVWAINGTTGDMEITLSPGIAAAMTSNSGVRHIQELSSDLRVPLEFRVKVRADAAWAALGNYVMMGICLEIEDANKWVRIDYYNAGANGSYYAQAVNDPVNVMVNAAAPSVGDKVIRATIGADRKTIEVAFSSDDGATWDAVGSGVLADMVTAVGITASQESTNPGFVAKYAYAELVPWAPVPKGGAGPWTITDGSVGNGIVAKYPNQVNYSDGDWVYIKAIPDTGNKFVSWADGWPDAGRFLRLVQNETPTPTFAATSLAVLSGVVVTVGRTILDVAFDISDPVTATLEFGTTTGYELGTLQDNELSTSKIFTAEGLPSGTLIYYRLRVYRDGVAEAEQTGSATTNALAHIDADISVEGGSADRALIKGSSMLTLQGASTLAVSGFQRVTLNGKSFVPCYGASRGGVETDHWTLEIPRHNLKPESINVFRYYIVDTAGTGAEGSVQINLTNAAEDTNPVSRTIDCTTLASVFDEFQIVDGDWEITTGGANEGLRLASNPGYDRIATFLDADNCRQRNIDVLIEFTPEFVRADLHILGILFAFHGHPLDCDVSSSTCDPLECVTRKWIPHGYLPCIEFTAASPYATVYHGQSRGAQNAIGASLVAGTTYRMRCQVGLTTDGLPIGRVRHWIPPAAEPGWEASLIYPRNQHVRLNGSVGLVAHHINPVVHSIEVLEF